MLDVVFVSLHAGKIEDRVYIVIGVGVSIFVISISLAICGALYYIHTVRRKRRDNSNGKRQ